MITIVVPRLPTTIIPRCQDAIYVTKAERSDTRLLWQEGTLLSSLRNNLTSEALSYEDTEWVLYLDSDMLFPPNLITALLDRATRNNLKFLSGFYFSKDVSTISPVASKYVGIVSGAPSFIPVFDEAMEFLTKHQAKGITDEYAYLDAPDEEALLPIGGCGAGCMLVHRDVLEKVGAPWFSFERGCSEDYFFSLRVQEAGFPMFADLSVQCGHMTIAAVSYRTFVTKYPKGQASFRSNVGNSHIFALAKYFDISDMDVVDKLREAAKVKVHDFTNPDYVYKLVSWNTSVAFATLVNNTARFTMANKGEALVFGGGVGTEAAFLAQNGWHADNYDTSPIVNNYVKYFISTMKLEDSISILDNIPPDKKYDLIQAIDVFAFVDDVKEVFNDLITNHLKPGGFLAMYNDPKYVFGKNNLYLWPDLISDNKLIQKSSIMYQFLP